ncbi:MAG: helix-turn-helix transcriptional regulator [Propionivibrio sp.]
MATSFLQLQQRLAYNTRQARTRLGLSQEALAFEAEIDRTYVSQIERGVGNPSLRIMNQLSSVLEIGVDELLKECGPNSPP